VDVVGSEHHPERRLRVQPAPELALRCSRCEAPVDAIQRYCIVCGAHQLHVEDPVARHMSALQAQRRAAGTIGRDTRGTLTIGRALLVACLPLALIIGAIAGRVSTNGDAAVSAALRARHAPVVLLASPAGTASAPAAISAALRAIQSQATATTTTRAGAAQPTSASRPRGRRRPQKSTGGSYVRSQQALPNQISVP
jgi:hypothetical protein